MECLIIFTAGDLYSLPGVPLLDGPASLANIIFRQYLWEYLKFVYSTSVLCSKISSVIYLKWRIRLTVDARISCGQHPIKKLLQTLASWNFRLYRSFSPRKWIYLKQNYIFLSRKIMIFGRKDHEASDEVFF